jgi:5-methylcytosine-specific restriction endonuclease McrA
MRKFCPECDQIRYDKKKLRKQMKPSKTVQEFIFARDDYTCVYCKTSPAVVCDHVVPISRGGTKDPQNLVASCKECNEAKNDSVLN